LWLQQHKETIHVDFGLVLGPVFPGRAEMKPLEAFQLEMQFAERAAAGDFDGFSIGHHYLPGPEAQFFQPLPLAGHLLGKFPDKYLATTIFILTYHNPVAIAEQIATLDAISPGRFLFGVGQGYKAKEAHAFGIEGSERRLRLVECIECIRLLWEGGEVSHDGQFFRFESADIGLIPSKPPPIMVAADKLRTVEAVPSMGGDFWVSSARHSLTFLSKAVPAYQRSVEEAGREFLGIPMTRDVCLAKDVKAAEQLVSESYEHMLHMQSKWGQPGERYDVPFAELMNERIVLGSSEQVSEGLIQLNRKFRGECIFMRVYTPGMDPQRALDMVSEIGETVLPVVRREVGTGSLFT
jgi:alkanesulfonate monooxygenase SsuD/methylene tetrahydromethanopterin reductase-like flavin-dependent oxidoreductase (luciferase family)